MINYCPGCAHPVLMRHLDGTCGDKACREYVAARKRGENPESPQTVAVRDWLKSMEACKECERLRGLLSIARGGLLEAAEELWRYSGARAAAAESVYRRSDPDSTPEDAKP